MTDPLPQPAPEPLAEAAPSARHPSKPFRKRYTENRLSPDSAARQGRVTKLAWEKLGGTEAAMQFLNAQDEALGGRPLDLAVKSAEGLAAVEAAIVALAANRT